MPPTCRMNRPLGVPDVVDAVLSSAHYVARNGVAYRRFHTLRYIDFGVMRH